MLDARDGRAAIRRLAEGNSAIVARVALLDDVVRSAAHEPDAARVWAYDEQLRRDGYARIVAHLAGRFGLAAGLDPAGAVDILLTLGGPATYRSLVADYRWSHDRFVDWLTTTLSQQLLAPRAEPGTGQRRQPPAPHALDEADSDGTAWPAGRAATTREEASLCAAIGIG